MSASSYNLHRESRFVLKRFRRSPPSLSIELYPKHFRFKGQNGVFLYDSPMKAILQAVRAQRIPYDLGPTLAAVQVPHYDGCLIVELIDHRGRPPPQQQQHQPGGGPPPPPPPQRPVRVVLHPALGNIWTDVTAMADASPERWDDYDALELESRFLAATNPPLYVGNSFFATRVANSAIAITSPSPVVPRSLTDPTPASSSSSAADTMTAVRASKKARGGPHSKIDQDEAIRRNQAYHVGEVAKEPGSFQPSFSLITLIESWAARHKTTKPGEGLPVKPTPVSAPVAPAAAAAFAAQSARASPATLSSSFTQTGFNAFSSQPPTAAATAPAPPAAKVKVSVKKPTTTAAAATTVAAASPIVAEEEAKGDATPAAAGGGSYSGKQPRQASAAADGATEDAASAAATAAAAASTTTKKKKAAGGLKKAKEPPAGGVSAGGPAKKQRLSNPPPPPTAVTAGKTPVPPAASPMLGSKHPPPPQPQPQMQAPQFSFPPHPTNAPTAAQLHALQQRLQRAQQGGKTAPPQSPQVAGKTTPSYGNGAAGGGGFPGQSGQWGGGGR